MKEDEDRWKPLSGAIFSVAGMEYSGKESLVALSLALSTKRADLLQLGWAILALVRSACSFPRPT